MAAVSEELELTLPDVAAWRAWLDQHEGSSEGVWLVLAKKGVTTPTSLSYADALQEALCSGWIDGQRKARDETTFRQRFTPRRRASIWSQRNVGYVEALIAEGRMRARGFAEIERAQSDGRWDRAYSGQASAEVPADLAAALQASPTAQATFEALGSQGRYHVLHQLMIAANPATRARRIEKFLEKLSRGETP
ncbi:YdeI/OmpD-associated family protein [Nesterenkonia sandarakina]|uniref:YdeI/OmpD-associated family protein n=1 Tax=Nesterenkonia sandarakina TaxID=272918 RepID=UPI001C5447E3|nr:YdeI/OmpD-associated family protein [Nesterenkonia sandarakina]